MNLSQAILRDSKKMAISHKISIITPFFNSSKSFLDTYNSVVDQSYTNFEWIIVDDASTESEWDWLHNLASGDCRIKVVRSEINRGAGAARNIGLSHVTGEYLTFIDSDDVWDKRFLDVMSGLLVFSSADIIYGGYNREYPDMRTDIFLPLKINNRGNIFSGCDISCLATMIKVPIGGIKSRFGEIRLRNDLVFFYGLLESLTAFPVPVVLATYRVSSKSLSGNKFRALIFQFLACRRYGSFSVVKSLILTLFWALHGIRKYRYVG